MVGTLGLALFLYTVGVQYGKQFFTGLTSRNGRGVLLAGAVSLVLVKMINAISVIRGTPKLTCSSQSAIGASL